MLRFKHRAIKLTMPIELSSQYSYDVLFLLHGAGAGRVGICRHTSLVPHVRAEYGAIRKVFFDRTIREYCNEIWKVPVS